MTMTSRFVAHGNSILAAVAVLLAMMCSPIRPDRVSHKVPLPNLLPRNFGKHRTVPVGQLKVPSHLLLSELASLSSETEDDLDADLEDELTAIIALAAVSSEILPSPCAEPSSKRVR